MSYQLNTHSKTQVETIVLSSNMITIAKNMGEFACFIEIAKKAEALARRLL